MLLSAIVPNVYQFKDFRGSSHRILLDLIRLHQLQGRLLDLGAAGGELGDVLQDRFDFRFGVEHDVRCIPELRLRYDHALIADLESLERLPGEFDAIVLADILEHLREPRKVLALVRRSLKDSGRVFISVPNIANITIRIGLLLGIFTYRERGILDHTHLRFYTLKTIRDEIEAAGFEIELIRGSSVPIRLIVGKYVPGAIISAGEWILVHLTRMWKALFAYQFIIVARRPSN